MTDDLIGILFFRCPDCDVGQVIRLWLKLTMALGVAILWTPDTFKSEEFCDLGFPVERV
jgi:hypothetical protein